MAKSLSLAGALLIALSTACFAQAGGSDREGGGGDKGPGAQAPQPVTPSAGKGSTDSDRSGGMEKKSDKPNSNAASAPVNSGGH